MYGDATAIDSMARDVDRLAAEVRQRCDVLVDQSRHAQWVSAAGMDFRERADAAAAMLRRHTEALLAAAASLRRHAATMRERARLVRAVEGAVVHWLGGESGAAHERGQRMSGGMA